MAFSECGKGHIFNTDQYSSCPYCNGGGNQVFFGSGAADIGKTVPAGDAMSGASDIGKTVPAGAAMAGVVDAGKTVADGEAMAGYGMQQPVNNSPVRVVPASDIGKTVAVSKKNMNIEPVVGWFVCVEGKDKGRDYRILAKNNSIGRGEGNDICIRGDQSIARENQGKLGYDVKHNTFHIIPGDGANNIYIDDNPVYIPTKLEPYQLLEIGETKLVFVPFCGDKFSWEDGLKK